MRVVFLVVGPFLALITALSGCNSSKKEVNAEQAQKKSAAITVQTTGQNSIVIGTPTAVFEVLPSGYLRAFLKSGAGRLTLDDTDAKTVLDSSYPVINGNAVRDFSRTPDPARVSDFSDSGMSGKRIEFKEQSASVPTLEKAVVVEVREDLPNLAVMRTTYQNRGTSEILLDEVTDQAHRFSASNTDASIAPYKMWSFQGASAKWGLDEVLPLTKSFSRENLMQQIIQGSPGTGGGIPVAAFWNAQVGEAIGHLEKIPVVLSIPVKVEGDQRVHTSITVPVHTSVAPNAQFSAPSTFLAVYHGDFYEPLRMYSLALSSRGWKLPKPSDAAYKANWCGWGYELNVTAAQMTQTIPKLKELGIGWATLDAGWFNNRGDWQPRNDLGASTIKNIVETFHQQGIRLTLWWIPIVAEDGHEKDILNNQPYKLSEVVKQHPEWLILDKDGKPARMTSGMVGLCPAIPEVRAYYKELTERFIRDWDFDGHKLDFSYAVPPCFNAKHHHASPEDSTHAIGDIYKIIFDTTHQLKPDSVTQSCPCGTPPNFAWLPYLDQAVTADPVGSAQVRRRIKMYKALLGPTAAVYGDHVELTRIRGANTSHEEDYGSDFASTIGPGGVPGTKFTWPDYGKKFRSVNLTPEKEALWRKWLKIYDDKMLASGTFLDLYVYGYDAPEAYAIAKDGKMYYAFFAPDSALWKGTLELRGLGSGRYRVMNYETGEMLGTVDAKDPRLATQFSEHLLLEASPE